MIAYAISHLGPVLRETFALTPALRQITLSHTSHVGPVDSTVHHVRRDPACENAGAPSSPCPAPGLVQDRLAAGGQCLPGCPEDTWPETWATVPSLCPVCRSVTVPDRYLNSRAGPGWRCSLAGCEHFWQVRMAPLHRYLATHPPEPAYPWYGQSEDQRCAWLETHGHPPRLAPSPTSMRALTPAGEQTRLDRHSLALDLSWPEPVRLQTEPSPPVHTPT
jgi:hypothetical protein